MLYIKLIYYIYENILRFEKFLRKRKLWDLVNRIKYIIFRMITKDVFLMIIM